jgi:hypothetical protein
MIVLLAKQTKKRFGMNHGGTEVRKTAGHGGSTTAACPAEPVQSAVLSRCNGRRRRSETFSSSSPFKFARSSVVNLD